MSDARPWPGYRWAIVAAMFVVTMLSVGSTLYAFGVLVKPVAAELGLSRATVNLGLVVIQLGAAVAGPLLGRLVDRMSARLVLMLAAPVFAASMVGIAASDNIWVIAAIMLVPLALAWVCTAGLISALLVARWFSTDRSLGMGIIAASTSAGGFLVVPAVAWLLERFGWCETVAISGVAVGAVTFLLAFLVVRDWPDASARTGRAAGAVAETARLGFAQLARAPHFWAIALSAGSVTAIDQALLATLIPYATDQGFTLAQAALLLSCLTGFSIAGKLGISALADRVEKRALFAVIALCNAAFLGVLLVLPPYAALLPVCCVMGFMLGGTLPIWHALIADQFGAANFGAVYGAMTPITLCLSMSAIWSVGHAFDAYGNYAPAFAIFAAITVAAAIGIRFAKPALPDAVPRGRTI